MWRREVSRRAWGWESLVRRAALLDMRSHPKPRHSLIWSTTTLLRALLKRIIRRSLTKKKQARFKPGVRSRPGCYLRKISHRLAETMMRVWMRDSLKDWVRNGVYRSQDSPSLLAFFAHRQEKTIIKRKAHYVWPS
jgi:hypothetical protein